MKKFKLWQCVLLATQILWKQSEEFYFWPEVDIIIDFLRDETTFNLQLNSMTTPVLYQMNDDADPSVDLRNLINFIEKSNLLENKYIKLYNDLLRELLSDYEKKTN